MKKAIREHELSNELIKGRGKYLVVEVSNDIQLKERPLLKAGSRLVVTGNNIIDRTYLCLGPKSYDPDSVAWKHVSMWCLSCDEVRAIGRVDHQ